MSLLEDDKTCDGGTTEDLTVGEPRASKRSEITLRDRLAALALKILGVLVLFLFLWKGLILHWDYPFFDFPSFYYGAWSTFRDHIAPYDYPHLTQYSQILDSRIFPYVYPPFSILIFYPLILVPYEIASRALLIGNCLIPIALCWFLFRRILRNVDPALYYGGMLLFLFSSPINITIEAGQINLLVLALMLLFWYFLKTSSSSWQGSGMLALAVTLKTYPVIFLMYLLKSRRYQLVSATVIFLGLMCVLSMYLLPPNSWSLWYQEVLPSGGYGKVPAHLFPPDHPQNQSLNGMMYRLFEGNSTGLFLTYASVGVLFFVVLLTPSKIVDRSVTVDLDMALFLLLLQLAAPYSWQHHLVFSLLALMTGVHYALKYHFKGVASMLLLSTFLIASDYPVDLPWFQSSALFAPLIYLKLFSVLLSLGLICWMKATCYKEPDAACSC